MRQFERSVGLADQARRSLWDSQVVVAAARTGAAVLYTEDLNDGQEILGVRISNPFAAGSTRVTVPCPLMAGADIRSECGSLISLTPPLCRRLTGEQKQ